jgi:hypothetical protein
LSTGETEVEEDQIRGGESTFDGDGRQLGEPSLDQYCGRPKLGQRHPAGLDRRGIAVDPEQAAARCESIKNLAGMARLPEGAVDRDRARSGL